MFFLSSLIFVINQLIVSNFLSRLPSISTTYLSSYRNDDTSFSSISNASFTIIVTLMVVCTSEVLSIDRPNRFYIAKNFFYNNRNYEICFNSYLVILCNKLEVFFVDELNDSYRTALVSSIFVPIDGSDHETVDIPNWTQIVYVLAELSVFVGFVRDV